LGNWKICPVERNTKLVVLVTMVVQVLVMWWTGGGGGSLVVHMGCHRTDYYS